MFVQEFAMDAARKLEDEGQWSRTWNGKGCG